MAVGDDDKLFEEAMQALGVNRPRTTPISQSACHDEALIRRLALGIEPTKTSVPRDVPDTATDHSDATKVDFSQEDAAFEAAMAGVEQTTAVDPPPEAEAPARTELERVHVGTPRVLRRRIKQGGIRHEAELDLHGMTRDEAMSAVERFVASSSREGLRVVRVITGRGLHSAGGEAVLMHALERWLEGPLRPWAYSSVIAPPSHGGEGMRYIFLRRFAASLE